MKAEPQNPSFQDLLAHAGWIRALARSLVSDPSVADDVVQDAWVAALQRPPKEDENLRGWLATVVRNAVRMRGRAAGRRAAHETRATEEREASLPSSGELAERIETQQRLAALVLELGEPYRQTVLLRYFEGLSSAEIARRTGAKPGTVRWRLSQGLDELRERLDDDFGGERAAWLGLLLPLAENDVALVASAAGGTGLLSGIFAMNLGLKITLGVAAVAAAFLFSPFGSTLLPGLAKEAPLADPVEVSFQPMPAPETPAEPVAASESEEDRVALVQETTDAAPAIRSGYRARLIDPEGQPVAGAAFFLPEFSETRTLSDAEGVVELLLNEALFEQELLGLVRFSHPAFVIGDAEAQAVRDQIVDLGELTLQPAGAIEGRVVDAEGRPVSSAWVRIAKDIDQSREEVLRHTAAALLGGHGEPDEQGRFLLERVPVGDVHLWAGATARAMDGAKPAHEAVLSGAIEVRKGQISTGVELRLGLPNPENYITGVVVDPAGVPVPRADLHYEYRGSGRSGMGSTGCDEEGRFTLAYVPKAPRKLRASDRKGRYADAMHAEARGGDNIILRLRDPETMTLTVTGEGPLEDLFVWGYGTESEDRVVRPEEVQFEGSVGRIVLPAEPFVLKVSAAGHEVTELGPFDGLSAPRQLEVALTSLPGIRGRVVDSAGQPVEAATVELYERADRRIEHNDFLVRVRPRRAAATKTNEAGEFSLTLRESGEFYLRVEAPGFAPAEQGPFALDPKQGRDGLEVKMTEGGAIEGYVAPPGGGSSAGLIVAISRGDAKAVTQRVSADGSYSFEHLTPGPWHVRLVQAEIVKGNSTTTNSGKPFNEAELPVDLTVEEGRTARYDLSSKTPSTLSGTIQLDGAPAQGWTVTLNETEGGGRAVPRASVQVDAKGSFELQAPAPGHYTARLAGTDQLGFTVSEDLILAPGANRWDLDYDTGTVRIENVIRAGSGATPSLDLMIGEDGARFVIVPLLAGEDGVAVLEKVPAVRARVARVSVTATITDVDPRTAGETLATFEVVAGEETTVQLP